jgi:hypothetical protein
MSNSTPNPIDVYNPNTIAEVRRIIHGLIFFNGRDKDFEQIESDLKENSKDIFTLFHGKKHSEDISVIIDCLNMIFSIHTLGQRNSITQLLQHRRDLQLLKFKKKYGISYKTVAYALYDIKNNNGTSATDFSDYLDRALDAIGMDKIAFLSSPSKQALAHAKLNNMIHDFLDNVNYYSDDEQENEDCLYLEKYCNAFKSEIESNYNNILKTLNYDSLEDDDPIEFLEHLAFNRNNKFALGAWESLLTKDPIFRAYSNNAQKGSVLFKLSSKLLKPRGNTSTQAFRTKENVVFGIDIDDRCFIHEVEHAISNSGFDVDRTQNVPDSYNNSAVFRKYEPIDEIVVDWFSGLIYDNYYSTHPHYCRLVPNDSLYSTAFPIMSRFLHTMEGELKESIIDEDPIGMMNKIIGEENFELLSSLSLDVLSLSHPDVQSENLDRLEELKNLQTEAQNHLQTTSNEIAMKHHLIRYIAKSIEKEPDKAGEILRQALGFKFAPIIDKISRLIESIGYKGKRYKDEDSNEM